MDSHLLIQNILLPIAFGLLGFIEPCSIGITLLFIKFLENFSFKQKLSQVLVFTIARAIFFGALGASALVLGSAFAYLQRTVWLIFGLAFVLMGIAYLSGHIKYLKHRLGPSILRLSNTSGSILAGIVFALNIPACATPLLVALLGMSAALGTAESALLLGVISLSFFGLGLSLPLILLAVFPKTRRLLDHIARWSEKSNILVGLILLILGLWSIGFGVLVKPELTQDNFSTISNGFKSVTKT